MNDFGLVMQNRCRTVEGIKACAAFAIEFYEPLIRKVKLQLCKIPVSANKALLNVNVINPAVLGMKFCEFLGHASC